MSHEATELGLYVDNDGQLYEQYRKPLYRTLALKKTSGSYARADAMRAFERIVDEGARRYEKDFMNPGDARRVFSRADRHEVAGDMADYFEAEYKLGNFNHLLPESAKAKAPGKKPAKKKTPAQLQRDINQVLGRK